MQNKYVHMKRYSCEVNVKSASSLVWIISGVQTSYVVSFQEKRGKEDLFSWKTNISGSNMKHKIAREIICVGRKRKKLKFHLRLCSARVGDSIIFVLISWQVHSKGADIIILSNSSIAKVIDWPREWLYFDPRISLSWKLDAILIIYVNVNQSELLKTIIMK